MLDDFADPEASAPGPDGRRRRNGESGPQGLPTLLAAVRQRRRTLIGTIILVPLCAFLTLRQVTPMYTATGSLIYEPAIYTLREMQSIARSDPITDAGMASQAEVLHSLHIAERVAERGHLGQDPEFNPSLRPPPLVRQAMTALQGLLGMETEIESETQADNPAYGPSPDPSVNQTIVAVQAALHAAPVRGSHVIEVSFTTHDPTVAAAAVNNAMDTYIKDQYAAKHRMVDKANELLERQARDLRQQVRQTEEKITAYREKHSLQHGMHASTDSERITHVTEDLVKARGELANADARLDAARGRAGAAAQAAVAPSVVQLRAQQDQLAAQIQSQRGRLGSAHPEAMSLNRQFAEGQRALSAEIGRVVAATEAEQQAAADRVTALERELQDADNGADAAARAEIPLEAMTRDLEAARSQLQAVLDRMQQTAQQAAIESSEAHEISLALPPEQPSSPRVVPMMAAATAAAIFLGLTLVYLLHLADNTLHSTDEVRAVTGLPCFALIPEVSRRALGHLRITDYVVRRPQAAFAEQVRALRAGLWLTSHLPGVGQPRVIAITAARPGEGKSVLTLVLGRSAKIGGSRVLVIECDLRQPSFAARLGGSSAPGLADILRGEATWPDVVQDDAMTGMAYMTAGKPGGDLLALFLSQAMAALLAEVRQRYDLVLLDASPIQAMTETRAVAAAADATLLCIRWRSTPRATLLNTLDLLNEAQAKIIGTVLTRVDPRAHLRSGAPDSEVYHRRYKAYYRGTN